MISTKYHCNNNDEITSDNTNHNINNSNFNNNSGNNDNNNNNNNNNNHNHNHNHHHHHHHNHHHRHHHNHNHNNDNNNNNNGKALLPIDSIQILFMQNNADNDQKSLENSKETNDNKCNCLLQQYFETLNVTDEEREGLNKLLEHIYNDKESLLMCKELTISDMILSYFSSYSVNNPEPAQCWQRWVKFRRETPFNNINMDEVKKFLNSGVYSVGFDKQKRPIWFVNTQCYSDDYSPEVVTKSSLIMLTSLLWDMKRNQFDFIALRNGICVYFNLSAFSVRMMSFKTLKLLKNALVAYPYQLIDIYVVNAPSFIHLARQVASKVVVPHAMDKFIIFKSVNELFEKYAHKSDVPTTAAGTFNITAMQWAKERGFIEN